MNRTNSYQGSLKVIVVSVEYRLLIDALVKEQDQGRRCAAQYHHLHADYRGHLSAGACGTRSPSWLALFAHDRPTSINAFQAFECLRRHACNGIDVFFVLNITKTDSREAVEHTLQDLKTRFNPPGNGASTSTSMSASMSAAATGSVRNPFAGKHVYVVDVAEERTQLSRLNHESSTSDSDSSPINTANILVKFGYKDLRTALLACIEQRRYNINSRFLEAQWKLLFADRILILPTLPSIHITQQGADLDVCQVILLVDAHTISDALAYDRAQDESTRAERPPRPEGTRARHAAGAHSHEHHGAQQGGRLDGRQVSGRDSIALHEPRDSRTRGHPRPCENHSCTALRLLLGRWSTGRMCVC